MFWDFLFKKKKKAIVSLTPKLKEEPVVKLKEELVPLQDVHHDYIAPKITQYDKDLMKQFLAENNNFENFQYRKGAKYTAFFGIENGWGVNMAPGYIRMHQGIDRARGGSITHNGKTIDDIVVCPMNFDSSDFIDYNGQAYGSLVFLINKKYGFELRIAHMNPGKNIIPWSLQQFKAHKSFQRGWFIGSAGTYGHSTGNHTHTELVSRDEACEVLELMLLERFGDRIYKSYTDEEIVNYYKEVAKDYPKTSPYVDWKDSQILVDWTNIKATRQIFFVNEYKCCMFYNNKPYTKYATNMVLEEL